MTMTTDLQRNFPSNHELQKKKTTNQRVLPTPSNHLQPTREKNHITSPPNHDARVTASVLKGHQSYGQISSKNLKSFSPLELMVFTGCLPPGSVGLERAVLRTVSCLFRRGRLTASVRRRSRRPCNRP